MLVFNSEMHLLTFIFIVVEFGMLVFYQLPHYLAHTKDKSRLYYLILLSLLLVYNVTGGLFPDPAIPLPITLQNIIAYGSGFLMASYFPYFFYKTLALEKLRFHALYGVPLFLLLPYLVFFAGFYTFTEDLDATIKWGMIIPFFYSIFIMAAILRALRIKFRQEDRAGYPVHQWEALSIYCAVLPWVCMTIFSYLHISQWIEVLCTNLGFICTTAAFISHAVRKEKINRRRLEELSVARPSDEEFEQNLNRYNFSNREIEIIRLLRMGNSKQEISEKLFIATATVSRHVQNIHYKAEVGNRIELMRRLESSYPDK
ncbi:response regulator transcription factor [Pedobacter paludis]|uniref:LuxR family transcriptional regulator n=1 Tax=Pedobacter paludis TaxID=2203212 RepID=A0A317F4V5_9SPHI|nr:helix-turn-helix transcriptional regulator [Pedobacter paludis]PWS33353.1 LuxR family transcriptional regulator [Pedobacter paludis]